MKEFEVKCPHCDEYIIIEQINCAIFRHGVMKSNMQQINPHMSKNQCDELMKQNMIYGCAKPFKLEMVDKIWKAVECDYI